MHDDITDMYYLKARYYAPDTGRFTQADIYHGDGLNLYVYAGNNPVKYVDPSGHCSKDNGVESGSETTRVGRWMSQEEYDKMIASGKIKMSGDNKVHVANPADINAFGKQAPKGSLYVEFDVPSNTISKLLIKLDF